MKYTLFKVVLIAVLVPTGQSSFAHTSDSIPFFHKMFYGPNAGFVWRLQSGYSRPGHVYGGVSELAAVVPVAAEIGYKYGFLEVGYRRLFGGSPLGMDHTVHFANSSRATMRQPVLAAMSAHQFITAIHFSAFHTPLYFKAGIGSWRLTKTSAGVTAIAQAPELSGYTSFPAALASVQMIGLGFEQNHFFAALEYQFLKWKEPSNYPGKIASLIVGMQFAPPCGHALDNRGVDFEERLYQFSFSVGYSALSAPWEERGLAGKTYFEAAVRVLPKWCIALAYHPLPNQFGYDQEKPEFYDYSGNLLFAPKIQFHNVIGHCRYWQLRADYYHDPYRNFKWVLSAGPGLYQIEPVGGYINQYTGFTVKPEYSEHTTGGLALGGGFDFRLFQSRVLFHKTASKFPAFMEWSMGLKLSCVKIRN